MQSISIEYTPAMSMLGGLGAWTASNESLLSGIAVIIVITGVIFTPIGAGLRRVLRSGGAAAVDRIEELCLCVGAAEGPDVGAA